MRRRYQAKSHATSISRLILLATLLIAPAGCGVSRMQQSMSRFWDNGLVGDDMGSLEESGDPWATNASREMAGHHPPGFSDPSDRYFQSERAAEINAGLDGTR